MRTPNRQLVVFALYTLCALRILLSCLNERAAARALWLIRQAHSRCLRRGLGHCAALEARGNLPAQSRRPDPGSGPRVLPSPLERLGHQRARRTVLSGELGGHPRGRAVHPISAGATGHLSVRKPGLEAGIGRRGRQQVRRAAFAGSVGDQRGVIVSVSLEHNGSTP